jgi:hypothetical protein
MENYAEPSAFVARSTAANGVSVAGDTPGLAAGRHLSPLIMCTDWSGAEILII